MGPELISMSPERINRGLIQILGLKLYLFEFEGLWQKVNCNFEWIKAELKNRC